MMNPTYTKNTFLSYFVLFFWGFLLVDFGLGQNQTTEIKVGVVLDLQTNFSKICLTSINMSLSDFYEDHPSYRTRLVLHVRDSMEDTVQASAAALDLFKNEQVSAIIGPISSMQAEFMIKMANKSQVPTITFSATSPLLKSINSPFFVRATLNDSSQVKAIAATIKYYGWRSVVAMYADNELGEGIMPYLSNALRGVDIDRIAISPQASDDNIKIVLYKLMTMQTRVFVVHMDSSLGIRIFQIAKVIGMMEEGYVWLLTNGMTHMMKHDRHGRSLETIEGVLGVRSLVPQSKELDDFGLRWKRQFKKENPLMGDSELNVYALWAYDSITALAMAVEKTSVENLRYDKASGLSNNMTDLGTIGVSRYGPSLIKALSDVRFKGLAGEFKLNGEELEATTFEIINFVGKEEKIIGLWTATNGLVNAKSNKKASFLGERLGPVIWPGKSTGVPKGWQIPTKGHKIRVGVPVKKGFFNFVEVKTDPISNQTTATGYSIDVFEAALKKLPYAVIPQYVASNSPYDDYNKLVSQIANETWDAVVGDVTITAHRSQYADFTLPYTESGVSMLVPMRDNENKNAWVFLQPWSWDLWITTVCFFVLIGFVVWMFEHRINSDFRGSPQQQIGTSFWFSFSTMVFSHREKVVSNLARFVMVVWCFVVLVLTQSYTANLTSFLTVQRFQPTVTNVNDLIKRGEPVGYQSGTFVHDILIDIGFKEHQLSTYGSAQECDDLLLKGTSKGGIAAAFDEVAYLKSILSEYCSKYAMVEPSFKTAGFGFAFPKDSPFTKDFSKAILNMTQSGEMRLIENKWFKKQDCPDPKTALSSNSLSLTSFWGLFIIAGIASFLAFLVFIALFLYEHRHTICDDSEDSLWRKLRFLFRSFDEKDVKSHTFKNSAVHNVSSPMTPDTRSPTNVQMRPWSRTMSLNRDFELRRTSLFMSQERLTTRPEHGEDGKSDIESRHDSEKLMKAHNKLDNLGPLHSIA